MNKSSSTFAHRRALAPVVANLLLIAIAVVGGTITVVFAQESYNSQVSGGIDIDFIKITGYDTRINCTLIFFGGYETNCGTAGSAQTPSWAPGVKQYDERIAVYVENHSTKKVLLSEIMFGGFAYTPTSGAQLSLWDDSINFVPGQYAIMDSDTSLLIAKNNEVQPGQTVTIVFDLESSFKYGRSAQMKITTGNDAVYVSDIKIGEHLVE